MLIEIYGTELEIIRKIVWREKKDGQSWAQSHGLDSETDLFPNANLFTFVDATKIFPSLNAAQDVFRQTRMQLDSENFDWMRNVNKVGINN